MNIETHNYSVRSWKIQSQSVWSLEFVSTFALKIFNDLSKSSTKCTRLLATVSTLNASRSFLSTLSTLVSIAGYMTGPTVCIFLIEWLYFRKADPSKLDPAIWNDAAALPSGIPAIISSLVPWVLIVTSMSTGWYMGPIAMRVGDLAY